MAFAHITATAFKFSTSISQSPLSPPLRCVSCVTGEGVPGFTVKAYDVTDRVRGMPEVALPPGLQVRSRSRS